ncbi:hypothetical protein TNCT_198791 [Trichonephila clavata]|uniref:Uncharacterized protein n=1 Tax=Trichonephila clavata TaxID=2740835 RepID=A0A8X6LHK9_TRICU|nr:hypothetical protein TNCT_198791 [Trichonephila clavata]
MQQFHNAPHVLVKGIIKNVMNEAWEQLEALSLGNVAEQRNGGTETKSSSQASEKIQSDPDGKRKVDLTDSESSEKMPKKHHME